MQFQGIASTHGHALHQALHTSTPTIIPSLSLYPACRISSRRLFEKLCRIPSRKGIIPHVLHLAKHYDLPPINSNLGDQYSKQVWKRFAKNSLMASEYSEFADDCAHLPVAKCDSLRLGKPLPHLSVTLGLPSLTRLNNYRIRLLVNCHGLESDISRFRNSDGTSTCRLCGTEPEDSAHFLLRCSALSPFRNLSHFPPNIQSMFHSDPISFLEVILGTHWINNRDLENS